MNKSLDWQLARYAGYALVFLTGVYLLSLVRGTLPIFFVALLFAYAMEPLLQRLERRGYTRKSAVGFVFLVFLLLFVCGLALLASAWQQVQALSSNADVYRERLTSYALGFRDKLEHSRLPDNVKKSIEQAIEKPPPGLMNGTTLLRNVPGLILSSLGTIFILLVLMPIITLWMMMEMNPMRARLLMLVPPIYRRDVTEIGQSINELLGRYVRGQMIVCGTYALLCTIAFHLLAFRYGMSYPLVLGLLAGFIYIVPYLGPATVVMAAGLTGYFTSNEPVTCAALAVGCCIVFNLVIDYGMAPRVLGKGVGLHPLMVIFALMSGAQIGGIAGMILAVPFTASLRVVLIYLFPQLTAPIPVTPPESQKPLSESTAQDVVRQTSTAEKEGLAAAPAVVSPATAASPGITPAATSSAPAKSDTR